MKTLCLMVLCAMLSGCAAGGWYAAPVVGWYSYPQYEREYDRNRNHDRDRGEGNHDRGAHEGRR